LPEDQGRQEGLTLGSLLEKQERRAGAEHVRADDGQLDAWTRKVRGCQYPGSALVNEPTGHGGTDVVRETVRRDRTAGTIDCKGGKDEV
jgi:hypothetical protein